jgi:hypothetical protein
LGLWPEVQQEEKLGVFYVEDGRTVVLQSAINRVCRKGWFGGSKSLEDEEGRLELGSPQKVLARESRLEQQLVGS